MGKKKSISELKPDEIALIPIAKTPLSVKDKDVFRGETKVGSVIAQNLTHFICKLENGEIEEVERPKESSIDEKRRARNMMVEVKCNICGEKLRTKAINAEYTLMAHMDMFHNPTDDEDDEDAEERAQNNVGGVPPW